MLDERFQHREPVFQYGDVNPQCETQTDRQRRLVDVTGCDSQLFKGVAVGLQKVDQGGGVLPAGGLDCEHGFGVFTHQGEIDQAMLVRGEDLLVDVLCLFIGDFFIFRECVGKLSFHQFEQRTRIVDRCDAFF